MKRTVAMALGVLLLAASPERAPAAKPNVTATPGGIGDGPLMRALADELARSFEKLELPGLPKPYYLAYAVDDSEVVYAEASFGALVRQDRRHSRRLHVQVRVGDPSFDNTNFGEGSAGAFGTTLQLEDDYGALRHGLWIASDDAYKAAAEQLERKRAVAKEESAEKDAPGDFSKEPPVHVVDERVPPSLDRDRAEKLARSLSAPFRASPDIQSGRARVMLVSARRLFVASDGTVVVIPQTVARVEVMCETQAEDGMPLKDIATFSAPTFEELPPESEMLAETKRIAAELVALRKAPIVDDYAGPVLFEGLAAGQVVREILAENLTGTPPPRSERPGGRGNMFADTELAGRLGQRILPVGFAIVDDPTVDRAGKRPLVGGYKVDDEGVPAQKVTLVTDGMLKTFLMSRTPRKGLDHSNGHGRESMFGSRAHPGNLFMTAAKGLSAADLRKHAIAAAKSEGLAYVLVVEKLDDSGGSDGGDVDYMGLFSGDGPTLPRPLVVRRIHADGKEELVRGATIGSLAVRAFKDVIDAGRDGTVYSFLASGFPARFDMLFGGRDSGGVIPTSIVTPSLLFKDVDIKKPKGASRKPPVLPRPEL